MVQQDLLSLDSHCPIIALHFPFDWFGGRCVVFNWFLNLLSSGRWWLNNLQFIYWFEFTALNYYFISIYCLFFSMLMKEANIFFFFFKELINRKQLSKAATESFELVLSWVPVSLFQKPYSGTSTACMKEPRVSHFWSQELKDQIINSSWLSVCWSSLPEALNILPGSLWWLLYMLFITLQFGTHKVLPEAHFELLHSRVFSTQPQLDWRHCSERLSSAGSLFQSILPVVWGSLLLTGRACACSKG